MLEGRALKMDRLHLNVLVDVTRTYRWQPATNISRRGRRTSGSGKHTEVRDHERLIEDVDGRVVRWILRDVESHVAEVSVVRDAVAAAKNRFASAEDVIGKADAWTGSAP